MAESAMMKVNVNLVGQYAEFLNITVSKRVLILRTWSLIRIFLAFWVLIGSLFIFQGPYFHYFGFIHSKNANFLIFARIGSGLHCRQILIFTYAYALIFIHRHFGSILRPLEGFEGLEGFRGLRRLEGLGGV